MPRTRPPWLSIVVPLKNEAENIDFVTEAIAAACADLGPYEVIYVDDGSTDATAATRAGAARALSDAAAGAARGQRRAVGGDPQRRARRPRRGDLHPRRRRAEPAGRDPQAGRRGWRARAFPRAWR